METLEDLEMINLVLEGKTKYFDFLVKKYSKKIYAYIIKIAGNRELANDIVQETFIKVYKNLDSFDTKKDFGVWIIAIARNTTLTYLKKASKNNTLEINYDLDSTKDLYKNSLCKSADKIYEEKEKKKKIIDIIHSLPEKYEQIIIMKYFDELNYKEISERLKIPISKVKWRLYTARKIISKQYYEWENCDLEVKSNGM